MNHFGFIKDINKPKLTFVSVGFMIGFGVGLFIRDILLWKRREEEYLHDLYKEIYAIKSDVHQISSKLEKTSEPKKNFTDVDFLTTYTYPGSESSNDNESFYSFSEDIANDLADFITEIELELKDGSCDSYTKCYELFLNVSWKYQDYSDFLWRFAMISYRTTLMDEMSDFERRERIFTSFNYALKAFKISPDDSEVHKWLAVLYGVTGLLSDTRTKILNGNKFKEHIDASLDLNPNDPYTNLLKGRFCYQVSELSFVERKLATLLFETPPTATIEEALECFLKCESLAPNKYAENHYYLHLCYKRVGDYTQSAQWLQSAKTIPLTDFDTEIKLKLSNS